MRAAALCLLTRAAEPTLPSQTLTALSRPFTLPLAGSSRTSFAGRRVLTALDSLVVQRAELVCEAAAARALTLVRGRHFLAHKVGRELIPMLEH